MAEGDSNYFDDFARQLFSGQHNFLTDEFRAFMITSTTPATAAMVKPTYPGDFDETFGDQNKEGGVLLTNVRVTESGGEVSVACDPIIFKTGANEPDDAMQFVVYNDTHPERLCVLYVEMSDDGATPVDLTAASFTWTPNSSGMIITERP